MVTITRHAKERYAERIKGREDRTDIAVYVAQNEDKIISDLNKMIEHSTKIYEGKSPKDAKQRHVIYRCGLWLLHVDPDKNVLITVYEIDLGVGQEINKAFADACCAEIVEAYAVYYSIKDDVDKQEIELKHQVAELDQQINEYKQRIKELETLKDCSVTMRSANQTKLAVAEDKIMDAVSKLTTKNHY